MKGLLLTPLCRASCAAARSHNGQVVDWVCVLACLLFFIPGGHGRLELRANRFRYQVVRRLAGDISDCRETNDAALAASECYLRRPTRPHHAPRNRQREGKRPQDSGVTRPIASFSVALP